MRHEGSFWHFSRREMNDLILATLAFGLALAFMRMGGIFAILSSGDSLFAVIIGMLIWGILYILALGPAFIIHELAHKFLARHYGCWAEFRADPKGLQFGIILSFLLGILFMAPGAVMVSGLVKRRYNGFVAVAGPLTNLTLFILGVPIWAVILGISGAFDGSHTSLFENGLSINVYLDGTNILWKSMLIDAAVVWLYANLVLGLFNMIPWGPLDGAKVKDWNEQVFYGVFAIFLIPVLGMFFGFWSPTSLLESIVTKLF